MSQMPEMPATGWAEQGYDPSAYPQQADAQSPQAQTSAVWQQDTEPDWGASQQGYPEQGYSEQRYPEQQYPQQQYQPYPAQQGYPADPTMAVPQQMMESDSGSELPTEFDHLFRDSPADTRRAIDRQKPMVGGAALSQQSAQSQQQADQYQTYQQPYPQQAEQYPGPAQYQGAQFPSAAAQYPQNDYQQGPGYANPGNGYGGAGNGFVGGTGGGGAGGGSLGGRLRNRKTLAVGGAVVVAAVIAIVVATSNSSPGSGNSATHGGTPSAAASKATPKQQADQIYQLIQQSSQLRSDANTAVVDVNGCKNLATAQSTLASTAQKRQSQADSVSKLDVSGIQNGSQLVGRLKAAWTASAQYDTAYSQIAGDMQGGCKTSSVRKDSNYQTANQAAGTADDAKSQAARLWNDNVATPLGESQVTSDKL